MKSIFRKSAIGIAILGIASSAYAGTITGAFIGGEGLDLQPRNGDLDFVTVFPTSSSPPMVSPIFTQNIDPSYSWGWRLYGGLKFCGNDDLTVSWERFYANNHKEYIIPSTSSATIDPRWLFSDTWAGDIYSRVKFHLDDVYAVFGHTMNRHAWSVRYAAGAEWFRLKADHYIEATSSATPGFDDLYGYEAKDDTHGFGPRVEFDMTYHMPYGIGAFAKANGALLISSRKIDLVSEYTGTGSSGLDDFDFAARRTVIPHLGLKLGLSFGHVFGDVGGEGASCNATSFTIEAGWQVDSYIHAIERPEGFENNSTNAGALSNVATKTSNYNTQGLFVGVKLSTGWF